VIGLNGIGKTTLLKLILGDLSPDAGFIDRYKNCRVAYMTQDVDIDPEMTAFEVVRHGVARIIYLGNYSDYERQHRVN
jgi:ATPase subunit of ABC transporter with duplicated ATPase domains